MKSNLNSCHLNVKPDNVLEGVREKTKEYTLASMVAKFAAARARGVDPDTTNEGTEVTEVGFGAVAFFERGQGIIFAGQGIFDPKVVVKSIGPKTCVQARTGEHGTKCIANRLVGLFDRAVLVRAVRASWANVIAKFGEKSTDFGALVSFSSLVQIDVGGANCATR
jgi:hypothetical protein